MSHHVSRMHVRKKNVNKFLEIVAEFKYAEATVTNENCKLFCSSASMHFAFLTAKLC
jgi:hypothetical protein